MVYKEQAASDTVDDGPPISVPDSGDTGESGKLKMIVQLVRKCMGIKDIASMRLSLPASLLEPVPNLEYWHYLDRPDLFAAINDSEDPFERMLAALRFTFSKDLKFIRGKVCKPYNSVLGEHFRAHWDVIPVSYPADPRGPPLQHLYISSPASTSSLSATRLSLETDSIKSGRSAFSYISFGRTAKSTPATSPEPVGSNVDAQMSSLSLGAGATELLEADSNDKTKRIRVIYVTEQVSHHPPVSSYYASCPARQVELRGVDQISAKVSGTTLRVSPGLYNKGIFVKITGGPGEGEEYHITHPVASVNGILRGNFYITVADSTIVTVKGAKDGVGYRAVIEYKEESWLGRAMFALEGVIHTYEEGETEYKEWTKAKHVPTDRIVAYFDGSWKGRIRYRLANGSTSWATLIDISTLHPVPKAVRALESQLPTESRKLWDSVTSRLLNKEYSEATKFKQAIEQKQRDDATERRNRGVEFIPVYFEKDIDGGTPQLTVEGRKAVEEEIAESSSYPLETVPSKPT
ncbi:hypothetical protein BDM02DRAFT_3086907 [Thelephora ganbajun]|uniref:Uncharacterized protein n=1 Tax=Thelephora ganbajun TaxID=370292 RepID=A0ACB6ZV90_THEGA|nr:hypothetical protein BDM02DRAFT_3086907 [Thelephora ganbajun]